MTVLIFLIGLVLGSFLSMVFHRLEVDEAGITRATKKSSRKKTSQRRRESLRDAVFGRSRCDHCRKTVAWYDNIPLASFLALRGRCRHCRKPISHYHPVLELSSGLYLLAAYQFFGLSLQLAVAAFFGLVMLLIFAYDLRHEIIPDVIVVPAIAFALVALVYQSASFIQGGDTQLLFWAADPASYLVGGLVVGGFFLALSVLSRGSWIGGGDIKLGVLIGLLLGWPYALIALFLAYMIGTAVAAALLVGKHATLKSNVPFAPMLVSGFLVAAFYGQPILDWYQRLVIP